MNEERSTKTLPSPTFMEQMPDGTWRPTDRDTGVVYWAGAPTLDDPRGTSMLRPLFPAWSKRNP